MGEKYGKYLTGPMAREPAYKTWTYSNMVYAYEFCTKKLIFKVKKSEKKN